MSRVLALGGAFIPVANIDSANEYMERQGYGPDFFSTPLEQEKPPHKLTHYATYMPMNGALFNAVGHCVNTYGGEWISPTKLQRDGAKVTIERKQKMIKDLREKVKLRVRRKKPKKEKFA